MAQPWFKLYAGDYLSDPDIALLTYDKRGILLQLWAFAWKAGSIPADLDELAMLTGLPAKVMRLHSSWIRKFFHPVPEDASRLISPRMELEREASQTKGLKAQASALQRWSKRDANDMRTHMRTHCGAPCESDAEPVLSEVRNQKSEKEQQPPTPFGAGGPSAGADVAVMVVLEPPAKKPRPKSRDKRYAIAALGLPPDVAEAFEHCWDGYPKTGWDFRTKAAQPRRINRALAAERFGDVCKHLDFETVDGRKLCPQDLTDAVLAWVNRKRTEAQRQYGPGMPPCVPCIANTFSSVEGSKKHWQEALLEFFGVAEVGA